MHETKDQAVTPAAIEDGNEIQMTQSHTMKAIVQDEYGSADVLHIAEIDRPVIGEDDVLVRVHAAGLDRGTWHLMAGLPYLIRVGFGFRGPKNPVPGLDVAGTVVAVGENVTRFQAGDEVFGTAKGSFAEYASALQDKLAIKPANLTFGQAAAVPVSGLTAIQALRDVGRLEPGQQVLIVGASGGVGTYAVQLAKAFGAEVTGVASTAKVDLVRSIGADHVIDYTQEDFADGSQHYDLILDVGGNSPLSKLRAALTQSGTLVIVGGEEGGRWFGGINRQLRAMALSPFIGQRLTTFISKENHADLERLTEIIEAGDLTPVIDRTYPLGQAPQAMRHLEAGQARGKIVITVRSPE
jgi:NADPH:quinone reductase-like Zn-dependent oxidoreductase